MWAGMRGQATEPWHGEGVGWRARVVVLLLVLLWTGSMGRPWAEPGAQLQGTQGGSHWFGQITSSKWNHSPVTVFHCLTTLSAARPGVRRGAQGRK